MSERIIDKPCQQCGDIMKNVNSKRKFCDKCNEEKRIKNWKIMF